MPYSVPASKPGTLPNNTTNTSRLLPYITKATNTGTLTNQVKVLSNTPMDVEKRVQFKNTPISVPNISQVKKGIISASGKGSQRTNTRTTRRSPLKNLIQQSTNNSNTKKLLSPVSPEIQTRDIPLPGTPNQTKTFE